MPDHTFALSKSAAVELLTLSTTRGLLTKPVHLRKVSQFMREHLAPLLRDKQEFDLDAAMAEFGTFTINERTRDGLKALLAAAAEKGAMSGNLGTGELLDLFGLAED